jgi:hypothetical protein
LTGQGQSDCPLCRVAFVQTIRQQIQLYRFIPINDALDGRENDADAVELTLCRLDFGILGGCDCGRAFRQQLNPSLS